MVTPPTSDADSPTLKYKQPNVRVRDFGQTQPTSTTTATRITNNQETIDRLARSRPSPVQPIRSRSTTYRGTKRRRTRRELHSIAILLRDIKQSVEAIHARQSEASNITGTRHTEATETKIDDTKDVQQDLEAILKTNLTNLLLARKNTSLAVEDADESEDEIEDEPIKPAFIEKAPLFLRRPPSPAIRYPRGCVMIPANIVSSSGETDVEEVEVEYLKPRGKVLKTLDGMIGRMRNKFESESWAKMLEEQIGAFLQRREAGIVEGSGGEDDMLREQVEKWLVEGREGRVHWKEGVGKLVNMPHDDGPAGDVHVFLDHSNIHHGMIDALVSRPLPSLPIGSKKILNLPILTLLLLRGRKTAQGGMHLVASSPLEQRLDGAVKLGWRCSVLKRVEVDMNSDGSGSGSDVESGAEGKEIQVKIKNHNRKGRVVSILDPAQANVTATTTEESDSTPILPSLTDPSITARRMREQAVDELIHLQILETLVVSPRPGTLILGTGDAKGGQFNDLGFLGCVRIAIERGWKVELWGWRKGTSRMWREEAKRQGWGRRQFRIYELDEWAEDVVVERERSSKKHRRRD